MAIAQVNIDLFNQYNLIKYNSTEYECGEIYILSQMRGGIAVKDATGYTLVKNHFARSLIPDECAVEFSGFFGTSLILIFWIE
ncbi:hypothetical protein LNO20_18770 [Klebsiella quasipneumoniae subsp. quasipneumoniae]|nr:hypothetical protein [Klebsiella quasipneumoniae subsp. quasipneumoniae]